MSDFDSFSTSKVRLYYHYYYLLYFLCCTGASSDIQQATRLAKAMVTKYGLSDKMGLFYIDEKDTSVSIETKQECDQEIRTLLKDSYQRAKNLLETNKSSLDRVAHGLMEYESLNCSEDNDNNSSISY